MTTSSNQRLDVYASITHQIIKAIELGTGDVKMPWHRSGGSIERPVNVESKRAYRGVNTVALWASAHCQHYDNGLWGTYRQWQTKGAQVRKGEKASLIIFYRDLEPSDQDSGSTDEGGSRRFVARASTVFNLAQVDGYELGEIETSIDRVDRSFEAESLIASSKAKISIGGDSAFYRLSDDTITMPDRTRFIGTPTSTPTEAWYSTLLHELTHWSGAKHRLDRNFNEIKGGRRTATDAYAMEEMVAELGAAFLCADLGISSDPRPDHADYIGHWLNILKADNKAIFTAASAANKAAEYLKAFVQSQDSEAA